ncbi:hypothetical protein [Mesorhizobium sp. CAU 1732]|uniref:alpha/beta fold hydrolase n=1 Tax=Mesorhizobium sp. CAU 1732 TaxID=3140358 RepID=UPI0032613F99
MAVVWVPLSGTSDSQALAIHNCGRPAAIGKTVLVGHSMGRAVAMTYGTPFPEEVAAIVVLRFH